MENKFEWNDKLVEEFAQSLNINIAKELEKNLEKFKQSKQRKPLLVVEGKELFEGDGVWCISFNNEIIYHQVNEFSRDLTDETCTFLTEESAKKWLAENKKTISYKELEWYANHCKYWKKLDGCSSKWIVQEDLINYFKPKQ